MNADPGIEVWDLALALPVESGEAVPRPIVRALRARISADTVTKLLSRAGVESRLADGRVEINLKLPVARLTGTLTAAAPGNGRLRLEAATLTLGGLLPVPGWMVGLALARIEGKPGVHRVGPRAIEFDVAEALAGAPKPVPLRWETGVRAVKITREFLEIECRDQ